MGVLGSKSLDDERVTEVIAREAVRLGANRIVTAMETDGVCAMARRYATQVKLPLLLHPRPEWAGHGAHTERTNAIIRDSDHLLLIHDGVSSDMEGFLRLAKKRKQPYICETLDPLPQPVVQTKLPRLRIINSRSRRV